MHKRIRDAAQGSQSAPCSLQGLWGLLNQSMALLCALLFCTNCSSRGPLPCDSTKTQIAEAKLEALPSPYCSQSVPRFEAQCDLAVALIDTDEDTIRVSWSDQKTQEANQYQKQKGLIVGPMAYDVSPHYEAYVPDDFPEAFTPYLEAAQPVKWWDERKPWARAFSLRAESSITIGALSAARAGAAPNTAALTLAQKAGSVLLKSQEDAERGLFPFPDLDGLSQDAAPLNQALHQRALNHDVVCQCYNAGWWVNDLGGGELQSENAEAAMAIIALYEATNDETYLQSAVEAGLWIMDVPMVPKAEHTADSLWLLTALYRLTDDRRFLDAAVVRAELGVVPAQYVDGPYAGLWLSSKTHSMESQFRILRGLSALLLSLPAEHRLLASVEDAVRTGFSAAQRQVEQEGLTGINTGLSATSSLLLSDDQQDRLPRPELMWFLETFGRFIAERGPSTFPVAPGAFGQYLEAGSLFLFEKN